LASRHSLGWKFNDETCAIKAVMAIFNPNSSTMKFDMFVNEGESEPGAFRSAASSSD
jgi:hypothetical protein